MAWRRTGAKPLPEPILAYCQLDSWEQISMTFESQLPFLFKKIHLKMSSAKMAAILTRKETSFNPLMYNSFPMLAHCLRDDSCKPTPPSPKLHLCVFSGSPEMTFLMYTYHLTSIKETATEKGQGRRYLYASAFLHTGNYAINVESKKKYKRIILLVLSLEYSERNMSISWLLTPWFLASPELQKLWYWLCRINVCLSSMTKDFNYLYHLDI